MLIRTATITSISSTESRPQVVKRATQYPDDQQAGGATDPGLDNPPQRRHNLVAPVDRRGEGTYDQCSCTRRS